MSCAIHKYFIIFSPFAVYLTLRDVTPNSFVSGRPIIMAPYSVSLLIGVWVIDYFNILAFGGVRTNLAHDPTLEEDPCIILTLFYHLVVACVQLSLICF